MNTMKGISNVRKIIRNSMRTPDGTHMVSYSRHDYKTYVDKNGEEYMVDGGNDYISRSLNDIPATDTTLYTDMPHEELRDEVTWGVAKDGESHHIPISKLSRAHIANIIMDGYTGRHIDLMIKEIEWRNEHETINQAHLAEIEREESY